MNCIAPLTAEQDYTTNYKPVALSLVAAEAPPVLKLLPTAQHSVLSTGWELEEA